MKLRSTFSFEQTSLDMSVDMQSCDLQLEDQIQIELLSEDQIHLELLRYHQFLLAKANVSLSQ